MRDEIDLEQRLRMRRRPQGRASMLQTWRRLLFMHWPVPAEDLQALFPERVAVDTFGGRAWIGLVPFTMTGIRHPRLPAIPGLSATRELNVRSYVHYQGQPGVWFFSLDASHRLMVWGARKFFHLPYFRAIMSDRREATRIEYQSRRIHPAAPSAEMKAAWEVGQRLEEAEPRSLEFFLTERYCLYTAHRGRLYQGRIHHTPWPLRAANLIRLDSNVVQSSGIDLPERPPLLHYADSLDVEIFPLRPIADLDDPRRWRTGQPD